MEANREEQSKTAGGKPSVSPEATSSETLSDVERNESDAASSAPSDSTPSPDGQFDTAGAPSVKEDPGPM